MKSGCAHIASASLHLCPTFPRSLNSSLSAGPLDLHRLWLSPTTSLPPQHFLSILFSPYITSFSLSLSLSQYLTFVCPNSVPMKERKLPVQVQKVMRRMSCQDSAGTNESLETKQGRDGKIPRTEKKTNRIYVRCSWETCIGCWTSRRYVPSTCGPPTLLHAFPALRPPHSSHGGTPTQS